MWIGLKQGPNKSTEFYASSIFSLFESAQPIVDGRMKSSITVELICCPIHHSSLPSLLKFLNSRRSHQHVGDHHCHNTAEGPYVARLAHQVLLESIFHCLTFGCNIIPNHIFEERFGFGSDFFQIREPKIREQKGRVAH